MSLDETIVLVRKEHGLGTGIGALVCVDGSLIKGYNPNIQKLTVTETERVFAATEQEAMNILSNKGILKGDHTGRYNLRRINNPPVLDSSGNMIAYSAPVKFFIDLWYLCTRQCRHCHTESSERRDDVFDRTIVESIAHELGSSGVFTVAIGGGEPLHPKYVQDLLFPFVEILRAYGIHTTVSTNGDPLNNTIYKQEIASTFKRLGVHVNVSIEGREETHNSIRGRHAYKHAVQALEFLTEQGLTVNIATTVSKENGTIGDMNHVIYLAERYGTILKVKRVKPAGNAITHSCVFSEQSEAYWNVVKFLNQPHFPTIYLEEPMNLRYVPRPANDLAFRLEHCGAGISTLCVTPSHRTGICPFLPLELGPKIYETREGPTIMDVWQGNVKYPALLQMRQLPAGDDCKNCYRKDFCHGSCPAMRYAYSNSLTGQDPCCPEKLGSFFSNVQGAFAAK
ncbi:MAG: radical SAM protein [Candidatus Woesearchaeota archaeon]